MNRITHELQIAHAAGISIALFWPRFAEGFEEALLQSVAERFAPGKFNDTPDPQRVVEVVSASPYERACLTGA